MATYLGKKWRLQTIYSTTPAGLTTAEHQLNYYLNVTDGGDPGTDFGDFSVTTRGMIEIGLADYQDTVQDLIEPLFHSSANFTRCELWAADVGSEDFIFYATAPIGHVGSNVTPPTAYLGQIMTLRCQNGNSMRMSFLETSLVAGLKDPYPFANAPSAALAAHMVASATGAIVNKRFSFPIAPINNCMEQNEHLWDLRNR